MPPAGKDDHDPFNTRRPRVYELRGWRLCIFYPIAWLLILYMKSWRLRMSPADTQLISDTPHPRLIVMWHNRSLLAPVIFERFLDPPRIAVLISPSRMAAWEVSFFRLFKLKVVRGSSTRRSVQAGIELLRTMRKGNDTALSPDGPSGPLYSFQKGAVAIARKAKAPVLLVMPNAKPSVRMNTWDRHLLPLPFARIDVNIRRIQPDDKLWDDPDEDVATELRRVCLEITQDPFTVVDHG